MGAMKILDIGQPQNVYEPAAKGIEAEKEKNTVSQPVLMRDAVNAAAELSISKEGYAAWETEVSEGRKGSFGTLTGMDKIGEKYAINEEMYRDVFWEHMGNFADAMRKAERKYHRGDDDGVDAFMKTVMDAYETVHRKIIEAHKDGNREVVYDGEREKSLTLEEDLKGLDEVYDLWLSAIDGYISTQQRMKDWRPTGLSGVGGASADGEYVKKYTGEEYNEYRRSAIEMMQQERRDYLGLFKSMNQKEGIAVGVLSDLMNKTSGFWAKTRELWG